MMQTHGDFFYPFICTKKISVFLYFHCNGAAVRAGGRCSLSDILTVPFIAPRALRGSGREPPWGADGTAGRGSREAPGPAASFQAQAGLASTAPGPPAGPGAARAAGGSCAPRGAPGIMGGCGGAKRAGAAAGVERSRAETARPGHARPRPRHRPFLSWPRPGSGSSAGRRGPAPSAAERPAGGAERGRPQPGAGGRSVHPANEPSPWEEVLKKGLSGLVPASSLGAPFQVVGTTTDVCPAVRVSTVALPRRLNSRPPSVPQSVHAHGSRGWPVLGSVDSSEVPAVHHFLHLTAPWGQLLVSMPSTESTSKLFLVLVSLLLVLPVVEALDAGDTIAFLLGLAVSVVGFCACLGLYARRRNGQQ